MPGISSSPQIADKFGPPCWPIVRLDVRLDVRLRRFLVLAILLLTASFAFLDYWAYSRVEHADPLSWQELATGQGVAPAQYRVGVYYTANYLGSLTHLRFRHLFAASDFLCTGFSLAVLFFLLTRTFGFRERDLPSQWAIAILALLLTQFYLGWTFWFQEPETMPSFAVLAASALLCSGLLRISRAMVALTLVLVAILGATVRVDAVIAFHAGMLLAVLVSQAGEIPLGRAWQTGISLISLALASGIEHALAHTVFPSAPRDAALFQLLTNLHAFNGGVVLLLSLPACAFTVWLAFRCWRQLDGWARGLLLASLIHFVLFLCFGMSEEVRIFLPFALTLLPLSAPILFAWFAGEAAGYSGSR